MKIKYCGPGSFINVHPHGRHDKDEVKDYPDEFAEDLLATAKENKFEVVDGKSVDDNPLEKMTVAELQAILGDMEIDYSKDAKKADLISLVKAGKGE